MSSNERAHHAGPALSTYYVIFGCLAVLTALTVAVSRLEFSPAAAVILAFMIAISKGSLVVTFFMHLKYDSKVLCLFCVVPILLTLVLVIALLPDVGMMSGPLEAGAGSGSEAMAAAVVEESGHGH